MGARIAALGAPAILAPVAVFYVYSAAADAEPYDAATIAMFAAALGTAAALAATGPFLRARERRIGFLVTAAVLAAALGVISTVSIGPPLVPAVVLLLYAAFS